MWNERITIRNHANDTDSMGGSRLGTPTDTSIWAEVLEKNYSKIGDNGQVVGRLQYEITIYKGAGELASLNNDSRIIYRTRNLAIQSISQTQDRFKLKIIATESNTVGK